MTENIVDQVVENERFDFEKFQKEAIAGLKAGRPFLGSEKERCIFLPIK